MFYHKSSGLLMLGAIIARTGIALVSRAPPALPNPNLINLAGKWSHRTFYALMWFMPISGIVMGYYGGRGLPFFWTTIPGAKKADPSISKPAWLWHKRAGQVLEVLIPIHLGGVLFHSLKGQSVIARINPF